MARSFPPIRRPQASPQASSLRSGERQASCAATIIASAWSMPRSRHASGPGARASSNHAYSRPLTFFGGRGSIASASRTFSRPTRSPHGAPVLRWEKASEKPVAASTSSKMSVSRMSGIRGGDASGLIATFGVAYAVSLSGGGSMPTDVGSSWHDFLRCVVFRMLDAPLCGSWSVVTPFIRHLLNAVALGFALLSFESISSRTGQSSCQARRSVDRPLQPDDRYVVFYRATAQGARLRPVRHRAAGARERSFAAVGHYGRTGDQSARLRPVIIARTRFSLCSMLASTTPATCTPISPRVRFANSSCVSSTHSTPQ